MVYDLIKEYCLTQALRAETKKSFMPNEVTLLRHLFPWGVSKVVRKGDGR